MRGGARLSLNRVEDKLVLFVSYNRSDKELSSHSIIELPFPTVSEIKEWGNTDFRDKFMKKLSEKPEPLLVKFDDESHFSRFDDKHYWLT